MAVGPKGEVIGVDISDPMLGLAGRRCADLDQVRLVNADVCQLPVDDEILDVACALQVYCYVKELTKRFRNCTGRSSPAAAQ